MISAFTPGSRMSSSGTTTSTSSSFDRPASTSSIGRPPETNLPISSIGRCVAESPIRWNGSPVRRSRRSTESARWAPRLVPATACTSSRISVRTPVKVSRARGQHQEQRLGRRDQQVGRPAQHRRPLLLRRVSRAHRDVHVRLEAGERPAQVALDVVVERLQRGDVDEPRALAGLLEQPVEPVEERRKRLARTCRRLDQRVRAGGDLRPAERLRRVGPSKVRSNQERVAGLKTESASIAPA